MDDGNKDIGYYNYSSKQTTIVYMYVMYCASIGATEASHSYSILRFLFSRGIADRPKCLVQMSAPYT